MGEETSCQHTRIRRSIIAGIFLIMIRLSSLPQNRGTETLGIFGQGSRARRFRPTRSVESALSALGLPQYLSFGRCKLDGGVHVRWWIAAH
ncbi:hypothetical protein BRADI_2g30805v3 [Brachypodium distachyon]|uniref:Uncharacterized protein n=1 Tax=Brachypodium distachyon TaxID=15368 RepID=A0A2K2DB88_BRADI|nr:hypothetical protein BRADI_2g30805v3 [Brachypodium distachyon]